MIQIIIDTDNANEDFNSLAQNIANRYIEYHIQQIEEELKSTKSNIDNLEDEMKEACKLDIKTEQIAVNQFIEEYEINDIINKEGNYDLIVTGNNFYDMDIDFYYVF